MWSTTLSKPFSRSLSATASGRRNTHPLSETIFPPASQPASHQVVALDEVVDDRAFGVGAVARSSRTEGLQGHFSEQRSRNPCARTKPRKSRHVQCSEPPVGREQKPIRNRQRAPVPTVTATKIEIAAAERQQIVMREARIEHQARQSTRQRRKKTQWLRGSHHPLPEPPASVL